MKRLMLMSTVAVFYAVVGFAAAPQRELIATAEFAAFSEISKKVTALGAMINNPIVPALLLGSGQEQLAQAYGGFRSGSPIFCHVYAHSKDLEETVKKSSLDQVAGLFDFVLLYPSVDGLAKMALNHPGSTKEADGTLHLLASEDSPDDRWVKFTDDGRYCAFAGSAELARRAVADFTQRRPAAKKNGNAPVLLRVEVNECGLKTLFCLQDAIGTGTNAVQEVDKSALAKSSLVNRLLAVQTDQITRPQALVDSYSQLTVLVDLNDEGFSVNCQALPKPGAKTLPAAGFRLPSNVLDNVPVGSPFFAAVSTSLSGGYFTEAEFRADCKEIAKVFREDAVTEIKKEKATEKYGALLDELGAAAEAYLLAIPCPANSDWGVFALAFDGEHHPYGVSAGDCAALPAYQKSARIFADRVFAAVDRQWPGRHLANRSPQDVYTFDWGALVDIAAAESDVGAQYTKEIANAKKTLESVLGSTKTVCTPKTNGSRYQMLIAQPGFALPATKSTGEADIARALPETVKDRPAGVLYLTPYALARDVILPIVAKLSDKKTAAQYQTMLESMAPAAPNSALAAAGWVDTDGTMRGIFRITAGEIRNLGAAFNAFTAASLSSSTDEDEDK